METLMSTAGRFELLLRNPDGFLGSPRARASDGQDGMFTLGQPALSLATLSGTDNVSPNHYSGRLPTKLHGQKSLGGMLTEDLGGGLTLDGHSTRFISEPLLFKHGSNLTLHQWEDCADVLVSCQSQKQESFICQYGIAAGILSWSVTITRTCDMLWVGVTGNSMLDCERWIGDQPQTFLISEEATMLAALRDTHGAAAGTAPFPGLLHYGAPEGHLLLSDFPNADPGGIWCSVGLTLDMDAGQLWVDVSDGRKEGGSKKVLVFKNLPRGKTMYPCLSLCNAGQVVFRKDVGDGAD